MKKYSSIEQFRNVIKAVQLKHDYKGKDENDNPIYRHTENYPTLKFRGTVKLHGTNAGIVKYANGAIEFQSRSRVLSLDNDNSGFMSCMSEKNIEKLFDMFNCTDYIAIYGEWCGKGIQKGVALNQLEKMFVIFGIKIDDEWVDIPETLHDNDNGVYNIMQFPTYEIDIDFNYPERVQNDIIDMIMKVEQSCPVGKYFGVDGIGEGIVFTCIDDQTLKFKSKGEKHSVTKVKKLNSVNTEMMNSINEFVEYAVTENRLEQGVSYFNENNIEIDSKNTGQFLSWVVRDVLKEESDTIETNNLDDKSLKKAIVTKARVWFLNKI